MTPPVRYEKPEVLARLPALDHAVIEASAGTGKTYTIEHLVVDLLLVHAIPISQILVVTFTEKATAELRKRVRELIVKLATVDPKTAPKVAPGKPAWEIDDAARERLAAALRDYDNATISTIHGFCNRVLAEHAFANQRLFKESRVEGFTAFEAAFKELLRTSFARDPDLRAILQRWLSHEGDVEKLQSLLYECLQEPSRLVPVYSPDRLEAALAAFPDEEVFAAALAEIDSTKMNGSTRRACRSRIEAMREAVAQARAADHPLDRMVALDEAFSGETVAYLEDRAGGSGPNVARILQASRVLAASIVSLPAAVVSAFLPPIRQRLAARKLQRGEFDFADMLELVRESLFGPRGPALVQALRDRYRCALIDEFQDTDPIQWAIFRRLFFESDQGHALYLIGDPKQAIYRFRGADVATYLRARRELVEKTGREPVPITRNYRSTRALIEACNRILDDNASPPFFTGEIRYSHPVECGNPRRKLLYGTGEAAPPVKVFHLETGKSLAKSAILPPLGDAIAREIKALIAPDSPLRYDDGSGKGPRPLGPADIYLLARAHDEGQMLGRSLAAAGIPHAFYKQEGLFQSDEARAVLDLLSAVARPSERTLRLRAWMTPFFALGLEDLDGARDLPGDHALVERLRSWKADADRGRFERLFSRILEESGVVRRAILVESGERAITNYLHLFEILLEEARRTSQGLPELVQVLRGYCEGTRPPPGEAGNMQRLETDRDAVQILTMHLAKGLEAPVVFLAGGVGAGNHDKLWVYHQGDERLAWVGRPPPEVKELADREEEWENERLLYVALTRAKARVYLPFLGKLPSQGEGLAEPLALRGTYARLNERVAALLDDPDALSGPEPMVEVESVDCTVSAAPPEAAEADQAPLRLEPTLLVEPPKADPVAARPEHAGYIVTSYTRMQAGLAHRSAEDAEEILAEVEDAPMEVRDDELPPGAGTGVFLHELLEALDPAWALEASDAAAFGARKEVAAVLERLRVRHGLSSRHIPHACDLAFTALRAPVRAGKTRIDGLATVEKPVHELEFLFPIPEETHPLLGSPQTGEREPFEIRRGLVKGFVDLVFEHEGRVFFADWKSNRLRRFDEAALVQEVERNYRLQAKLYTLALVRLLRLRREAEYEERFGGLLYLFVRGMRLDGDGGEGVFFERPRWEQVVAWEKELLRRTSFGPAAGGVA